MVLAKIRNLDTPIKSDARRQSCLQPECAETLFYLASRGDYYWYFPFDFLPGKYLHAKTGCGTPKFKNNGVLFNSLKSTKVQTQFTFFCS